MTNIAKSLFTYLAAVNDTEEATPTKAKCPFGFESSSNGTSQFSELLKGTQYPSEIYGDGIEQTTNLSKDTYEQLVHETILKYEAVDPTIKPNYNRRSLFVGCLLRQAGHDFMDYRWNDPNIGGSDGCINFQDPDNKGIPECIVDFGIDTFYKSWNTRVSLPDFMVIIAEAAIGRVATDNVDVKYDKDNYFRKDTYAKYLRDTFKYGRKTAKTCEWANHRMPNPEHACEGKGPGKDGLQQIFVENIYKDAEFPWTMLTAISGAHTVGSAKPEMSGYNGFWSDENNSGVFNNNYYRSVLMKGWSREVNVNGNKEKNQWKVSDLTRKNKHKEMMLITDMCLAYKNLEDMVVCKQSGGNIGWGSQRYDCLMSFYGAGKDLDPKEVNCCAWTKYIPMNGWGFDMRAKGRQTSYCGIEEGTSLTGQGGRDQCCDGVPRQPDCDHKYAATGYGWEDMMDFAYNEQMWLRYFTRAWHMANENGQSLKFLDESAAKDISKSEKKAEKQICVDMRGQCRHRPGCRRFSILGLTPEWNGQYDYYCLNEAKPQSNQRGDLTTRENFHKYNKLGINYNGGMSAFTQELRNVIHMANPTASSFKKGFPPSNILNRQNGWELTLDRDYYQTHQKPYDWGIRSWTTTSRWSHSSVWQSGTSDNEWLQLEFTDGDATVISFRVVLPMKDKTNFKKVKVYVGDNLCNEITKDHLQDAWVGAFQVNCIKPTVGHNIRIERTEGNWRMTLSDVMVWSSLPRPDYLKEPSRDYSILCSGLNKKCKCNGIAYFGKKNNWTEKKVKGTVTCNQATFGGKEKKGTCFCFDMANPLYGEHPSDLPW